MKTWKKVAIGIGVAAVLAIIVLVSIHQANKDVVTVQTGTVKPEDLSSIVTASGEVRPLNYTNVLGQGFGLITDIVVKEGDHVKKGALLVTVDNVQPRADVDAQSAHHERGRGGGFENGRRAEAGCGDGVQRRGEPPPERVPEGVGLRGGEAEGAWHYRHGFAGEGDRAGAAEVQRGRVRIGAGGQRHVGIVRRAEDSGDPRAAGAANARAGGIQHAARISAGVRLLGLSGKVNGFGTLLAKG